MRDYGTIDCRLWDHPDFKSLSVEAKLLIAYLRTCKHCNLIWCYHLPVGYIASDLGYPIDRVWDTLSEAAQNSFARYCKTTEYVFIPKYLDEFPIKGEKQQLGALKIIQSIPNKCVYLTDLITRFLERDDLHERIRNTLSDTLSNTLFDTQPHTHSAPSDTLSMPSKLDRQEQKNTATADVPATVADMTAATPATPETTPVIVSDKSTHVIDLVNKFQGDEKMENTLSHTLSDTPSIPHTIPPPITGTGSGTEKNLCPASGTIETLRTGTSRFPGLATILQAPQGKPGRQAQAPYRQGAESWLQRGAVHYCDTRLYQHATQHGRQRRWRAL